MSIRRGQIYFVDLNPVKGREQAGQRPVLVISSNRINSLPLVISVVVGTKGANIRRDFANNVRVSSRESGLPLETEYLCFQIRSLDYQRFPKMAAGELSEEKMIEVEEMLSGTV